MKTIVIVTQHFYPNHASTAQLMTDLAKGLAKRGYSVKVFTGTKLTDISTDCLNHLQITRSFSPFQESHSILGKITSSLFFLLGGLVYILQTDKNTPVLIASNPPYAGIIGLFFKIIKGGKYYFLLQDIFPESAVISGIIKNKSIIYNIFSKLIFFICSYSENTIVLSTSMKTFIEDKDPELKEKQNIKIIENWSIENIPVCDKHNNQFAIQHNLNKVFTVLYSGNIGRLHDIQTIANATQLLSDIPIQFVFIGDGAKKKILEQYQQEHQLKNILLLPFQPRELISSSLTACDVSLVSLIEGAEKIIAPCKLYGMLAAGRAIVSISQPNSYIARLLTTYNCGVNCPPNQPQKLANILYDLAENPLKVKIMGEKARQLYEQKYTFERAINEYEKMVLEAS